jgi:hypothetical protein
LAPNETLEPADYTGAHAALKVDRGHQAPLADFKGTTLWAETNYLSNITPQRSDLNQGPWVRLEHAVRASVGENRSVWVLTGPLYEQQWATLPGADEPHRIPSGYWKIIAQGTPPDPSSVRAVAFIFPQESRLCCFGVFDGGAELSLGSKRHFGLHFAGIGVEHIGKAPGGAINPLAADEVPDFLDHCKSRGAWCPSCRAPL